MYLIKFRLKASKELQKSYEFYEKQQSGLGEEFLFHIEKSLSIIETNPSQFKVFHKENREFVLKKFPFVITSVFHTSRNPKRKI